MSWPASSPLAPTSGPRRASSISKPAPVKKRMKDKAFARGVSREDIIKGAQELGVPLDEHITFCIAAMREQADALGLRGSL